MSGASSISLQIEEGDSEASAPVELASRAVHGVAPGSDQHVPFASFVQAHAGMSGKAIGRQGALLFAIALAHLCAVALFAQNHFAKPVPKPPVRLTLMSPRALFASAPRTVAPSGNAVAKPATPPPAHKPRTVLPPTVAAAAPTVQAEPAPSLSTEAPATTAAGNETPTTVEPFVGGTGLLTNTAPSAGPIAATAAPAARALEPDERRRLLQRYLNEMMGQRINQKRFYPAEAEEAGLQDTVVVRVIVDGAGRLLSATVVQGDHVPVLARAALTTINAAQPFPAPPSVLGDRVQVDVTLNYTLP